MHKGAFTALLSQVLVAALAYQHVASPKVSLVLGTALALVQAFAPSIMSSANAAVGQAQ